MSKLKPIDMRAVELAARAHARLASLDRLLDRGRGEWPASGYVKDETWTAWLAERDGIARLLAESGYPVTKR